MFITEKVEKEEKRVSNLKRNLIGKGIYVAIETAKYYILMNQNYQPILIPVIIEKK